MSNHKKSLYVEGEAYSKEFIEKNIICVRG
jgi:hypothetical protein